MLMRQHRGRSCGHQSAIHGQGYADLGFVIGETVDSLHVTEGVYDPRQGDFAVAGSIDLELGSERRGWLVNPASAAPGSACSVAPAKPIRRWKIPFRFSKPSSIGKSF